MLNFEKIERSTHPQIKLVPVLGDLEQNFRVHTAALGRVLHRDAGFLEHEVALLLALCNDTISMYSIFLKHKSIVSKSFKRNSSLEYSFLHLFIEWSPKVRKKCVPRIENKSLEEYTSKVWKKNFEVLRKMQRVQ